MDEEFISFVINHSQNQNNNQVIETGIDLSRSQFLKQKSIIIGYIRQTKLIEYSIITNTLIKYAKFHGNPHHDPANFINDTEIQSSEMFTLKGNALCKLKQYNQAIIKYSTAIKCNPNYHVAFAQTAFCYLKLSNTDCHSKALENIMKAIEIFPFNPKYWTLYGIIAYHLKDFKTAYLAFNTFQNTSKSPHFYDESINYNKLLMKINKSKSDKLWIEYFQQKLYDKCFLQRIKYYASKSKCKIGKLNNKYFANYRANLNKWYVLMHQSAAKPDRILQIAQTPMFCWSVSYTSNFAIYHNKRCFSVHIICLVTEKMEAHQIFHGYPTCQQLINLIITAMTFGYYSNRSCRPSHILLAHRFKRIANEVIDVMAEYGIYCRLESRADAKISAAMHNMDVDGFNYDYIKKSNCCSNKKCNKRRKLKGIQKIRFRICSQCKVAAYCSKKCQKYDWKYQHKYGCC